MLIYIVTSGVGGVHHVGTDQAAVRKWAEDRVIRRHAGADVEWRQEWGGTERLYYKPESTNRWNKIPALFLSSAELEAES